jgi:AcrR family transcriptional regulator
VYRHFGSHQEILSAVVYREAGLFWEQLQPHLQSSESFEDYLIEAMVHVIMHASETPTHSFLFNQDILPIVNQLYLSSADFISERAEFLRPAYERFHPGGGLDLLMVVEWFNRIVVSYLATPSPIFQSEDELRQLFRAMLGPVFRSP